jgi:hypothetical protein
MPDDDDLPSYLRWGRREWVPTDDQKAKVRDMRAQGAIIKTIARAIGVDQKTLRRACWEELGLKPKPRSATLFQKAMAGDMDAALRWLTRYDTTPEERAAFGMTLPPPSSRRG